MANVDQAHRLARRGEIERTDVEIADLIGRKHGEAAPACRHAGEIFRVVKMRRDAGAIADPDGFQHRLGGNQAAGIVGGGKSRQINGQRHRTGIQSGCALVANSLTYTVKYIGEQGALGLEVKSVQAVVIEKATVDGAGRLEQRGWVAAIEGFKIGAHGFGRLAAGVGCGPFARQTAQNRRPPAGPYTLCKEPGIDVLPLRGGCRL